MALFDIVIKNGMIVDGTRTPRLRADIGIKNGRIAEIGQLDASDAERVIDAGDCIVAPGFVDLHTHYDAQLFWDPYCTMSGWHGVTSVVIGNCGFGFAPVPPEMRERTMLSMTRVEAIPLDAMQAGMPWDWVTYPEFLDTIDAAPQGRQRAPLRAARPAAGLGAGPRRRQVRPGAHPRRDDASSRPCCTRRMDAGGCGWSAQRLPPDGGMANQRDFDGTPMPTDCMSDETRLEHGRGPRRAQRGLHADDLRDRQPQGRRAHFEELAEVSGRPMLYNVVVGHDR